MKPITLSFAALGFLFLAGLPGHAQTTGPVQAVIDDQQPGWRTLGAEDFVQVNSAAHTWLWQDDVLHCTGQPISVLRSRKQYENFELVVEWNHQKAGGNSGLFVWTSPASIERLLSPDNPGPPLPDGIEIQMLDHAFTEQAKARGEATDWFTTHGDVFPVRAQMTPFPPLSTVPNNGWSRRTLGEDPLKLQAGRRRGGVFLASY